MVKVSNLFVAHGHPTMPRNMSIMLSHKQIDQNRYIRIAYIPIIVRVCEMIVVFLSLTNSPEIKLKKCDKFLLFL